MLFGGWCLAKKMQHVELFITSNCGVVSARVGGLVIGSDLCPDCLQQSRHSAQQITMWLDCFKQSGHKSLPNNMARSLAPPSLPPSLPLSLSRTCHCYDGSSFANHMMVWGIKYNHITEFDLSSGYCT